MRNVLALCLLFILAACGRPLTPSESAFAASFLGPELDPSVVRFHEGLAPQTPRTVPVRPRRACSERIWPPHQTPTVEVTTAAIAAFRHVHWRDDLYLEDYLKGLPEGRLNLAAAMIFLHEMVHVWQWQARELTGYHPLRAAFEHLGSPDPYLFDPDTTAAFRDFGWEQQGAIAEEYLCCRLLDPEAPRTARLHAMLGAEFDLPPLSRPLAREVLLPWDGVEIEGICR